MKKPQLCRREFNASNLQKRLVFQFGPVEGTPGKEEMEYDKEHAHEFEKRLEDPKERAKQAAWLNITTQIEKAFDALGKNKDDIDKTKADQFRKNLEDNLKAIPLDQRQKGALWDRYNENNIKYQKYDNGFGSRFLITIEKDGNVKVEKQEISYDEAKKSLMNSFENKEYNISNESYDGPGFKNFNIKKYTDNLQKELTNFQYVIHRKLAGQNSFAYRYIVKPEKEKNVWYSIRVNYDKDGKPLIKTEKFLSQPTEND